MTDIAAGFREIDRQQDAGRFVAYLDAQSSDQFWKVRKRESVDALHLRPGDRGLDVGCGLGDEVRMMAELVDPSGLAVGIDWSGAFVREARARSGISSGSLFVHGDGHSLPFEDDAFAGARAERTLQHVRDPQVVIHEIARVVSPGGRIAVIEPDWDTLVIDAEPLELTRAFCRGWTQGVRHPNIGRELVAMLSHAGLANIEVWPITWLIPSFDVADQQFGISEMAEKVVHSEPEMASGAEQWFADVHDREAHREFFAAVTYFFVTARAA